MRAEIEEKLDKINRIRKEFRTIYLPGESFQGITKRLVGVALDNHDELNGVEKWLKQEAKDGK